MKKQIPIPNTDLEVKNNSDYIIINYNQGICKAMTLNLSGYTIWKLIDGIRNINEITKIIHSEQNSVQNIDVILKDIIKFVKKLNLEGFVDL